MEASKTLMSKLCGAGIPANYLEGASVTILQDLENTIDEPYLSNLCTITEFKEVQTKGEEKWQQYTSI